MLDARPQLRLPLREMTLAPRTWGWAWRHERGGSVG